MFIPIPFLNLTLFTFWNPVNNESATWMAKSAQLHFSFKPKSDFLVELEQQPKNPVNYCHNITRFLSDTFDKT